MDHRERKEVIRKFKERKPDWGAFAIRCIATGKVWVGSSPNLPAARNAAWFMLRAGSHREESMQIAWKEHGEQAFEFEVLERSEDEIDPILFRDALQQIKRNWAARLSAPMLL